jgi:glycosyltransferase involved in cell wall biosynthesis
MSKHFLFVTTDFYAAGSQRQTFELDVIFKKRGIKISILCLHDLNTGEQPDHYYELHKELGTSIDFISDILPKKKSLVQRVLNRLTGRTNKNELTKYIKQFDDILFFGEYTFKKLQLLTDFPPEKEHKIFIVSSRFQGKWARDFDKKCKYIFIDGSDNDEQVKWEFEGFEDYSHIFFPISLMPTDAYHKWKFRDLPNKKIGIFTRLSKTKPLDPFFYSFSILQEQFPSLELHVYGSGTPEGADYDRYINHLNLKNVYFRGHRDNLKQSINEDELDLVWFQGYFNRPGGYAGFDVAMTGTPQLFWDFFIGENEMINNTEFVYPHFKKVLPFCEATKEALFNKTFAERLSRDQFNDTMENRDMSKNIDLIMHLFQSES